MNIIFLKNHKHGSKNKQTVVFLNAALTVFFLHRSLTFYSNGNTLGLWVTEKGGLSHVRLSNEVLVLKLNLYFSSRLPGAATDMNGLSLFVYVGLRVCLCSSCVLECVCARERDSQWCYTFLIVVSFLLPQLKKLGIGTENTLYLYTRAFKCIKSWHAHAYIDEKNERTKARHKERERKKKEKFK